MSRIDCNEIVKRMEERLSADYQIELHEASTVQLHNALAEAVMAVTAKDCRESRRAHERVRRAYYFSAEYLMGRSVFSNLYNLGILDEMRTLLRERGADISAMEEIDDAALGNGGLGRLAACYLDSAATLGIPLEGYGLRYKFGLFKQTFVDGFQVEKADDWLKYGDPWSKRRDDKTVTVEFADQKVLAVPYDMPVFGYNTAHSGTLRLWQSEPIEEFDFNLFNEQEYALAVREKNGKFRVLTGNKIGSLLLYYMLSAMKERGAIPADGFVAKSIVSTRLADAICAHFGVKLRCTPTGFRFISELIEKSHTEQGFGTFIFGFEESYGFLAGGFARDKDAVCAAMLAAEACVYYRSMGKTLSDALGEIEALCGCYNEAVKSYTLSGKEGIERIAGAMAALRSDTPREFAGVAVDRFEDMRSGKAMDYAAGKETESEVTGMNAVRFLLSDGAWICVRPSGTEPKLKLYIGANAKTDEEVEALLNKLMADTDGKLSALLKG